MLTVGSTRLGVVGWVVISVGCRIGTVFVIGVKCLTVSLLIAEVDLVCLVLGPFLLMGCSGVTGAGPLLLVCLCVERSLRD